MYSFKSKLNSTFLTCHHYDLTIQLNGGNVTLSLSGTCYQWVDGQQEVNMARFNEATPTHC